MIDFTNLFSIITAVVAFAFLMVGYYYSVIFTQDFKNKNMTEKAAGVSVALLTAIFSAVYFYIFILPTFTRKIFIKGNPVNVPIP